MGAGVGVRLASKHLARDAANKMGGRRLGSSSGALHPQKGLFGAC